ncbi:hypothetical protein [Streptomyces sp. CBMA152]|uniref:hypothetical protein n=1 Tax=Streptomyces sp. CBMA152 TaxID=1896312 RepID=UPI00166126CB|nr:hypothetical protein [Streptomyces sp. CBMA152]MBD0747798.1 hypothetical protein [Streptomyces sp. CBMA152]
MARIAVHRRLSLTAVALLAAALAMAFAVWTGGSWYASAHDEQAAFARTRDAALQAGERAVQNMNTLDYGDLTRGLDAWEQSATGDLLNELKGSRTQFEQQVRDAKTATTAKVLSGAVTELDERAGRARVMVAIRITVVTADKKISTKDSRMLAELTRTPEGWKLSRLGQAPVGDATAPSTPSGS